MSTSYIPVVLRQLVSARANDCCEYCLMPQRAVFAVHEIDHIIAEKHGGETNEENLALSCAICNGYKGSDIASVDPFNDEIIPLYHPRKDHWHEHFELMGDAHIRPLSGRGRVTVRLLKMNQTERILERQMLMRAGVYPPV